MHDKEREYEMTMWDYQKAVDRISIINPKHINNMPLKYRERTLELLRKTIKNIDMIVIQIKVE